MRSFLRLFSIVLVLLPAALPAEDWKLMDNDDGIETFSRHVPGSPVVALRGRGKVAAPLWKVAAVILDTKRATEWVDSMERSSVVRLISPTVYIEYNHIGTPFILRDREFVSEVTLEAHPQDHSLDIRYRPTDDTAVPASKHVRGEITSGLFRLTSIAPGKEMLLDAELHCDPKGSVPKWVVNLFQKAWPRNTFESLRKQVAKPDIAIPSEFRPVLEKTLAY